MSSTGSSENAPLGPKPIGPKVRAAREARGISLRELARRVGVSASFISQLEHNKVNASVGTLYSLVDALGLSIDQLMSDAGPGALTRSAWQEESDGQGDRVRKPIDAPVQRADGRARIQFPGVIWERLTQAADPEVDFLQVEYAPGSASCPPNDMMRHGGREYGYILSGSLHLQVGFDSYDLSPGDAATFDSMTPHRMSNTTDEPCRAIWVVIGRREDSRAAGVPNPSLLTTHVPSLGP